MKVHTNQLKGVSKVDPSKRVKMTRMLERVRRAGGGRRLQSTHMYPEIMALIDDGWSVNEIARYSAMCDGPKTGARFWQIINEEEARRSRPAEVFEVPDHNREYTGWSLECFEAFFLKFSDYRYLPEHTKPWIRAFLTHRNLMLNVPPRHAKSTIFMVWVPIWLACRNRNVQVLLVSKTHNFAKDWATEIAGQMEYNQSLINAFGAFKPETTGDAPWRPAAGALTVRGRTKTAKGAQFTIESRGMDQQVLGKEADFVIVDDPTDQELTASEVQRKQQLRHLREQVFTRIEPRQDDIGGQAMVIGQRVAPEDLYGELERQEHERGPLRGQPLWHVEKYPAILDWGDFDGPSQTWVRQPTVLWPERWPFDELMLTYERVGGHAAFEMMYQQNPQPFAGGLAEIEWLEACKDHNRGVGQGIRQEGQFLPVVRILSVDPSSTEFNGIIVGDLLWNKEKFTFALTEVHLLKAGLNDLKKLIDDLIARTHPDYFIFEESGFLHWFREDPWFLSMKDRVHMILHHTGVNKNSMEYGVQSLAGDFEFKHISLPYGDPKSRKMTDLLIEHVLNYSPEAKKTSDLLMALWFVKYHYRKLRPLRIQASHVKSTKSARGWSFLAPMRKAQDTEDMAYKAWHKNKQKQDALERVKEQVG